MSAIAQTNTGDLDFSTGNLVVQTDIATVTAAKLSNMFGFFKGEWFRDAQVGFPLLQDFLVKNPNLNLLVSILKQTLLFAPGVKSVVDIQLQFLANLRQLQGQMIVQLESGEILTGSLGQPFIVTQGNG